MRYPTDERTHTHTSQPLHAFCLCMFIYFCHCDTVACLFLFPYILTICLFICLFVCDLAVDHLFARIEPVSVIQLTYSFVLKLFHLFPVNHTCGALPLGAINGLVDVRPIFVSK